jgi:intergrase/recombinase
MINTIMFAVVVLQLSAMTSSACNEASCTGFEETVRESMCIDAVNNYLGDTEKLNDTFEVSKDLTNVTMVTYEILVKNCGGVRLEDVVRISKNLING